MPRYDFLCHDCQRETVLYLHPGDKVNTNAVECEWCHGMKTELIAYFENQKAQILNLQYQIENLITQVDRILGAMGQLDLPDPDEVSKFN